MSTNESQRPKSYIFNVDLMIEDTSNAKALQTLLKALNEPPFTDFRIQSGMEFGKLIDQVKQEPREKASVNVPQKLAAKHAPAAHPAKNAPADETGKSVPAQLQGKHAQTAEPVKHTPQPAEPVKAAPAATKPPAGRAGTTDGTVPSQVAERFAGYIGTNKLIRLTINKGRGIKLSVPCRIVGFDESARSITVYHVDEKKVYTFTLNEIDDFQD